MNNTILYFIRHGETKSNKDRIRQGVFIDDHLNQEGVLQVEVLVPVIKRLNLNLLATSYLKRAEDTVQVIEDSLPKEIPIIHDFRLKERNFGSLTGKSQEEWDKLLPNNRELEKLQTYDYRPFGGESVDDVRQRGLSAIIDLINNHMGKKIGVIAHNGIIRLFLFHFPNTPRIFREVITDKDIANCDVYEFEASPGRIENIRSLLKP